MSNTWIVGCLIAAVVIFGLPEYLMVTNQSNVMTELAQIVQTSSQTTNQSLSQLTQTIGQAFNQLTQTIGQSNSVAQPSSSLPQTFGSVSGPDLYSTYFNVNGVINWYYKTAMSAASTTCSFKSPAATSTILSLNAYLASASSGTGLSLEIGQSTSPNATTTLITVNEAAAATTLLQATTTGSALTDGIIAPNTYINVKIGSSSPAGIKGTCQLNLLAI